MPSDFIERIISPQTEIQKEVTRIERQEKSEWVYWKIILNAAMDMAEEYKFENSKLREELRKLKEGNQ